jgi:hypothetical protein
MSLNRIHLLIVPVQSISYSIVISTPPFYNEAKAQGSLVSKRELGKLTIEVTAHVHHDKRRNKGLSK